MDKIEGYDIHDDIKIDLEQSFPDKQLTGTDTWRIIDTYIDSHGMERLELVWISFKKA